MITFYPGPSKIYEKIPDYLSEACASDILSTNHRSVQFMEMCKKTVELLHTKLNIPENYSILFTSSATECWEIISQSFIETGKGSLHTYNGAFGKKWFEYAFKLNNNSSNFTFKKENEISLSTLPDSISKDVICLTQNETSNGTQIHNVQIKIVQQKYEESLIAVDVTSSLGGIELKWENADIWFASVQKCLGLPAGMGLLIVSPRAIEKAKKINDYKFYNSFLFMYENILKFQTHYTPNVLSIFLLMRVMEEVENIKEIDIKIKKRTTKWFDFFKNHCSLKLLIENNFVRSDTIITITAENDEIISEYKKKALLSGIILGNGYGEWIDNTIRIANFPQINDSEIQKLMEVLNT